MYRSLCISAIAMIAACDPVDGGSAATEELEEDSGPLSSGESAPVIEHEEFSAPQSASQNVTITATITDEDDDIFLAQIHYRTQVSTYFFTTSLNPQSLTEYVGSIPSDDLGSGGMHYYIEAVDTSGNVAFLPEGAPSDYFSFDLVAR